MEDSTVYFIAIVVALGINLLILYAIIASATKAAKRYRSMNAIFYLIAEIAKVQGVDQVKIDELVKWAKD
jgi:hypothetical protein